MEQTYEDLKKKTVAQLREIASGLDHEAIKGYTQLNKEHLLEALCKALGIDTNKHHEVVGLDKAAIKVKLRELKKKRDEAEAAHDHNQLKFIRYQIRNLRRRIKKATV